MRETKTCVIVTRRKEEKKLFRRWEDNIKIDLELDTVACTKSFLLRKGTIRFN
jgi:hypothetical protein